MPMTGTSSQRTAAQIRERSVSLEVDLETQRAGGVNHRPVPLGRESVEDLDTSDPKLHPSRLRVLARSMVSCLGICALALFALVALLATIVSDSPSLASDADAERSPAGGTGGGGVVARAEHDGAAIPRQLVMMHRYESVDELPTGLQENIQRLRDMNPELKFQWFGDVACKEYIHTHYDAELVGFYEHEPEGSFRGDICRAAVLLREGGFYIDTDMQLAISVRDMVDATTTFMSVWCEAGVLNALLGSSAGNEVIRQSLAAIRRWYRQPTEERRGIMGPRTYASGLQRLVEARCPDRAYKLWRHGESLGSKYKMQLNYLVKTGDVQSFLDKEALEQHRTELQWSCGEEDVVRMYVEMPMNCEVVAPSVECPEDRATIYSRTRFEGMRVGLFEPHMPGHERKLVGWPRSVTCKTYGCGLARTPPPPG
mmetsp:Transcript_11276/g.39985  ORF Transcript_11276/g.39985 Transcript_11276/m.39985 type:complete len:427 (-) Transcript_11276:559-1839(-)|eukprot:CAMPEP_0203852084 /NCGR_PEP_ID=MMETSP0359-20131031/7719_1 /ASSEMBLY_ACC=CAM_ASM_000338 /TAXON_ID=268821 /ORGANISM="Scrippsiella Hangoei, Strain SHTV-5" /LENGTH=426 /DNA_ID=CAMNT_0050768183 /DNA_START=138 /DNA_END=1418 /DNA_ORIENTATION=-